MAKSDDQTPDAVTSLSAFTRRRGSMMPLNATTVVDQQLVVLLT